jgi:hypothetical protein
MNDSEGRKRLTILEIVYVARINLIGKAKKPYLVN